MNIKLLHISLCILLSPVVLQAQEDKVEEAFTYVYQSGAWDTHVCKDGVFVPVQQGGHTSGGGSTPENTRMYRFFLENFLKDRQIHSVVDIGCGDWQFSRLINWDEIDYTGYDVVKSVIEQDQIHFTKPNIHFVHGNAVNVNLPSADLLVCKDVLQHLPNEEILKLLPQLKKFKHCLIINDVDPNSLSSHNPNIPPGGLRHLDLTRPPFNVAARKILTYLTEDGATYKQILHIKN